MKAPFPKLLYIDTFSLHSTLHLFYLNKRSVDFFKKITDGLAARKHTMWTCVVSAQAVRVPGLYEEKYFKKLKRRLAKDGI